MPARADGSKRPAFEWKNSMSIRPKRSTVQAWYAEDPARGVGLICGKISGDLEMLELEAAAMSSNHMDKIRVECDARNITWLWDLLTLDGYAEWTPSGGIHLLYRITDHDVPGNTKIALTSGKATLAETRGEGGFVIVAPTQGSVHPSGEGWVCAAGKIGQVPAICWEDRELLHAAIKAGIDERPVQPALTPPSRPIRERRFGEITPIDDFRERGDWNEILTSRGWSYAGQQGGQELWTRPGKDPREGHSAAFGHNGSSNIYVWSGMDEERHYDKAQFVAFSDFNGDFAATTKWLAREGYGTPLTSITPLNPSPAIPAGPEATAYPSSELPTSETVEPPTPPSSRPPRMNKWTEVGAARFAAKLYGRDFIEVSEEFSERGSRGWRFYENGSWQEDLTKRVRRSMRDTSDLIEAQAEAIHDRAQEAFAESGTDDNKKSVQQASKLLTFAKGIASDRGLKAMTSLFSVEDGVTRSIKEFDTNPNLLCLNNGTFDLSTMRLREHDRDDLLTRRMDIAFDAEATCPQWERSMEDWIPDPQMRAYVQRALGYTLLGKVEEGVFFVPWGETGCGKSQFIETIKKVFGDFGTTAEASTFRDKVYGTSDSTNNLHDLRGRRFVSSSETTKGAGLNEELVKRATGEEALKTRALYQSNMEWTPEFVLWIATNFKPNLSADDSAIWRRVKPIEFPNNFSESQDRIKGLGKKMMAAELSGIFNWLLEGARAYLEIGLAEPESMTKAVQDYRDEQDPVTQFLAEAEANGKIEIVEDAECESSKIYNVYANFCIQNNLKPITPTRFGRILSDKKFETRRGTNGVKLRKGIRIVWIGESSAPAWGTGLRT